MFRRIHELPAAAFETLAAEARREGYLFLESLRDEWRTGTSRFDGPGEKLLGAFDGCLLAIGGLHADPYASQPRIGRLRRVYVAPTARRQGLAKGLVRQLLAGADGSFDVVRLRVPDERAAHFYEAIGFTPVSEPQITHMLRFG